MPGALRHSHQNTGLKSPKSAISPCEIAVSGSKNGDFTRGIAQSGYFNPYFGVRYARAVGAAVRFVPVTGPRGAPSRSARTVHWCDVRVIVADCSAEYSGRLSASLPPAKRVLLIKADNSLLIFSELGSYKPLNWMAAPCTLKDVTPDSVEAADGPAPEHILRVCADKTSDVLEVSLYHVYSDTTYDLGIDPGLIKDGVEDHLQRYLSEQIDRIGPGSKLIRREYPTAIGPVDIMALNADGEHVAIEIKRHGGIDGVEQLTRYCELLNANPLLAPVHGIFAAQTISPSGPRPRPGPRFRMPHPRL